jgi:hypothetical protein
MAKKKTQANPLLAKARNDRSRYVQKSGAVDWFSGLQSSNAAAAQELVEFVTDWINKGETRAILPSKASLLRFLKDSTDYCDNLTPARISRLIEKLSK